MAKTKPRVPAPMLATLVTAAFDDERWAFEPKWDGVRAAAVCEKTTQLISRNGNDITVAYPELADLHKAIKAKSAVLDGEIVAFEDGIPSFQKLQSRMHVRSVSEIERLSRLIPVAYVVFDLLELDGKSVMDRTYEDRRALLEKSVRTSKRLQISPAITGEGLTLFEAARAQGLEGIVAKRLDSRYEPGRRSKAWLKVKTTFDADVVIAGWNEGGGRRSGVLGSLILSVYDGKRLRYVGGVGTGFTDRSLRETQAALQPLATDEVPFTREEMRGKPEMRHAHWVRPELVAIIEFRQLTGDGKLRAPSFKGLRDDKSPRECTWEELKKAAGWKT